MKLVLITSDLALGASIQQEQTEISNDEIIKQCTDNKKDTIRFELSDGSYFYGQYKEFNDVDPNFITFIFEYFVDYDTTKETTWINID